MIRCWWERLLRTNDRANARSQRRFRAMIRARNYHGREAGLYCEAERLLDRLIEVRPEVQGCDHAAA